MKKRRNGFTLIELVVVIAIIGVLAAILVPSMVGYVKKSKVSSANSEANSLQKAINSVLIELDEEYDSGSDITAIEKSDRDSNEVSITPSSAETEIGKDVMWSKISHFLNKSKRLTFKAECEGGAVKAVAVCSDNTYTGTYPSGVVTVDNFTDYKGDYEKALADALTKLTT
ncbi:type II secretion system protein [uncultured Ruminococcus sp.]|uniref:type II secretion system protein n=1 Tax=uncultured Ruminococcus sp. TaxID=165186 RepID=UPI0025CC53D1|nr:type II secretion system protein [uncultured Ruminococcus sp.]